MITLSSAEFPYNNFVATYRTASSLENRKGQSGLVNNSDYVSQRFGLGPLIFIMYINHLPKSSRFYTVLNAILIFV